jgi:hypothetical protein
MRRWVIGLFLLSLVGVVLILVGGTALVAIGVACMGVAAVGAVSLAFFIVGRSEDDARAAEEAQRAPRPDEPGGADGRLTSRRPPRSRGDA